MRRSGYVFTLIIAAAALACRAERPQESKTFILGTTTSLEGSGLLREIAANLKRDTGLDLKPLVVGSGQALQLAAKGSMDVIITHDPEAERRFVAAHAPEVYRPFMWNDFVIAGPSDDPAGVKAAGTACDAFARIARAGSPFCSRNDSSGTHAKELQLWRAAGFDPEANRGYRKMGQPMAALLRSADEMEAYVLSDRATFAQHAPALRLAILFSGDRELRNVYAVTLPRAPESPQHRNARLFVEWLLQGRGRALVRDFEVRGQRMFHPL
jgi:tungstate transport system substrate-binding protein